MLRSHKTVTFCIGISVWLAGVVLAATALLLFSTLASAQQDSTESTLSTPTLTAQTGDNGVDLSWTAVTGATRYELYAWTSADGWQQIGGDNLTGASYTHTDVTDGTTYYYAVRAVNANETSAWSDYVSAAAGTPALSAPALTAHATANGIELSWTAITDATRYELWAWTNADGWWEIGGDNLTGTVFTHTDVSAGATYYYTVRAVNADGDESAWSPNISAIAQQQHTATVTPTPTITHTPPPPPAILTQPTATPTATATPTETSVPKNTPTATHTPQGRQQQQNDQEHTATPTATATETATVTSTPTATESPTATATPPAVPSLSVAPNENSVILSWSAVTGAARYELWVWDSVNLGRQIGGNSLTATTYTQNSLFAGRTYNYAIRSVGDTGVASAWSSYVPVTIPSHTATPTATNTLQTQQQQLEHTATPTPTATPTLLSGPTLTSTVTPTPTPTPQHSERPEVPDPPTVVVLGAGHVRVDWDDVPRATYYNLWYWAYPYWRSVKDEAARRGISFTFNGSSAVLTNLPTDFPTYSFRVLAENSVGLRISTSGSATNPEEYRLLPTPTPTLTPTVTPTPEGWPSAPNKPTASMNSNGSVSISWETVPESASYDVWLYHYVVFGFLRRWVKLPYNGVDVEVDGYVREDIRISISGTSATVTNLPYKTTYYFRVRAHNDVGATFSPSVSVANINAPTATPTATPTPTSTPDDG